MINFNSKKSFLFKLVTLLFYTLLLACFLYFPKLYDYFYRSDNVLNVYTFADMIPVETIRKFETMYGTKVQMRYFESNEELLVKLKITKGEGYDVITPSDYAVEILRKDNLLLPLQKNKIRVLSELDSRLLGHYFDQKNRYSLPLSWVTYGLVFKKDLFEDDKKPLSLKHLFEEPPKENGRYSYRVCMLDDYRETLFTASLYLSGHIEKVTAEDLSRIEKMLLKQKSWVESYLNQDLRYFMLSDIVQIALSPSAYVRKLFRSSDDFVFEIPKEGSIFSIDSIAIPVTSTKQDTAHAFINFVLSQEQSLLMNERYGFNPSNKKAYKKVDPAILHNVNFFPDTETFKRLHLIHNNFDVKMFEETWLNIKGF